jgi:hypothetical protein
MHGRTFAQTDGVNPVSKGRGPKPAPSHATPKSDPRQLADVIAEAEYFCGLLTAQGTRHQVIEIRMTHLTREQECEFMLKKYRETENPIWAWHAVGLWASAQASGPSESYPAPPVLCAFLARMSGNLVLLANGYPPTEYHDGEPKPAPEDVPQVAGAIDPVLTSSDGAKAAELLPEALFLRGDGWNAFREWQKVQAGLALSMSEDFLTAKLGDRRKAKERLIEQSKLNDHTTLRRKRKGGRGKKSPYPVVRAMRASGRAPEAEK